jgi:hypothetical protein
MGQTTITVQEQTLERFKQLKNELDEQQDAPDHTNELFLQALMDTWEAAGDGYYDNPDAEAIAEQLKNEISMANDPTVEVDTEGLIREMEKLQELVERVPENTADRFEEKYA